MLFILRAANARDRWARQVALPGGRMSHRKDGGKEFNAVVRELREEMGLRLDRTYAWLTYLI
jgi:8-oxo-dGTP pyrophosphatase MutT (NUDIX family)